MRFAILGPLEVRDGERTVPVPGTKLRALLAALLLHANHPVSVSTLTDVLWEDEPPARSDASLHNHVTRLRRTLGAYDADESSARIDTVGTGYRIRVADGELDLDDFSTALRRARRARERHDWAEVDRQTRAAETLWRGTPLAEPSPKALGPQIVQLVQARLELLEWHFDAALRLRSYDGAAARLSALVRQYPLNEALAVLLMKILHRTGQRAQALDVYQSLRRTLVEELGIEPGSAAQQVQQEVLADDRTGGAQPSDRKQRPENARPAVGPDRSDPDPGVAAPSGTRPAPVVPAAVPPTAIPAPPHRLPWDVVDFTGRTADADRLVAACRTAADGGPAAVHAVSGMPGVGKTAFAVHVAHRLAPDFPDGQIFLPLYGHAPGRQPVDPADALITLLLAVGVVSDRIPHDDLGRAALWREQVAGKRMLLVLDDARSSTQVIPLIPRSSGIATVITSRRRLLRLDCGVPMTLSVLTPEEAVDLFVIKSGRGPALIRDPDVAEAVRLCGRLPLAVQLLAARLRHHPAWTVRDVLGDLAAGRPRLSALVAEDLSAAATFDLSYHALPADPQRMFRRLGLFPGPDVDRYAAAALDDVPVPVAERLLEDLEEHHLLEEQERGRFRMHDLIREHARQLGAADDPTARDAAVDRLLDYYLRTAAAVEQRLAGELSAPASFPDRGVAPGPDPSPVPEWADADQARAWLYAECDNLAALIEYAAAHDRSGAAVDLSLLAQPALRVRGHWHRAAALSTLTVDAARQSGDGPRLAAALVQAAVVERFSGGYDLADKLLHEALGLVGAEADSLGRARVLKQRGVLRQLNGDLTAAEKDLRDALELFTGRDEREQASVLVALAHVDRALARYPEAGLAAESALRLFRTVDDRRGQAHALALLGDVQYRDGNHAEAARALRAAHDLYQAADDRQGQANVLIDEAAVLRATGHPVAAAAKLEEAVRLSRAIGDRFALADALTQLGGLGLAAEPGESADPGGQGGQSDQSEQGDRPHPVALRRLREALAISRQLAHRGATAQVLLLLGRAHLAAGHSRVAALHLEHARSLFAESGDTAGRDEALALLGAGDYSDGDSDGSGV